jgi:YD repeat-containing protein
VSNSKGRLTSASSSVSTTSITAYDALGRVTQSQQATAGQTYSFSYGYDLAGNLTSQIYPSGKVVVSGLDTAGRITSVAAGSTTYASSFSYSPQGAIGVMKLVPTPALTPAA